MALINNAHAGSQINLLCMIYRVIARNSGKYSVEEIAKTCAPGNLAALPDHVKRFPDNLRFWMHEAHQLWKENENNKLELTRVASEGSPQAIAVVVNDALFARRIDDIFGRDANDTEGLFRSLGCLLASDRFVMDSDQAITKANLEQFFVDCLPGHIPNDSEKVVVSRYGHFLGFLEIATSGEYLVDPTRAVRGVLGRVFFDKSELTIDEFLARLSDALPLLDRGNYREQVESKMVGPVSADKATRRISKSLSLALERLTFARVLRVEGDSDDPNACQLQMRGTKRVCSKVHYFAGGVR